MKCDTGLLRAYLDDALSETERGAVAGHLAGCASCQAELAMLQKRSVQVMTRLAILEPEAGEAPDPAAALARFYAGAPAQAASRPAPGRALWANLKRSYETMKQSLLTGWRKPVTIGATAVACLLILFSFAPVRQAAADFLGIFRVRKFAVIPIDAAHTRQLEELAQLADRGAFGQPTVVREPGEPQAVASAAEASALVGFPVRVPAALPEGALPRTFNVQSGPAAHFEMDRTTMQAVLDVTQIKGVTLPDVERIVIDLDVPWVVTQSYRRGASLWTISQLRSPQVDMPAGLDLTALGAAAFEYLGMPEADAQRLAQAIDWTSTVVIPLPTEEAEFREVTVDGVTGLLLEPRSSNPHRVVLWQRDDIVYTVEGVYTDARELLLVADALK
ncbi:MAG: hypothetical protein AUK03_00670 [Anaerolineae bacterium CG2_30_64_16]|nr:MAG: hypothetical protein AUK03_00670 [Anaerolineae bacterium CG2_30_64_16]